jgi:periplasmic divalent cation tolerance protein
MHSVYRWKGRVESAKEFLLIIKTTKARFPKLKAEVKRLNSYDVPEIIALTIASGASSYLAWIFETVRSPLKTKR